MHQYLTGFIRDIMYELASVGDLPLPQSSPTPNHKRDRDDDDPKSAVPASEPLQPSSAEKPRHYAGTKRVIDTRKARQDQFRSALSSSLSTMHLNGSHNGMALDPGSRTSSESGAHDGNLPTSATNAFAPSPATYDSSFNPILTEISPDTAS